jgi:hypothetical protein
MKALITSLWKQETIAHAGWELVIMRVLLALLLWDTQSAWVGELWDPVAMVRAMIERPFQWDYPWATQLHPNGIATWFDLTWIAHDPIEKTFRALMAASLIAYIFGVLSAVSLMIPILFSILAATLGNSQGAIGHTTQAMHQVALGIWVASVWCAVLQWKGRPLWRGMNRGQVEAEIGRQVLVAGYVVSAISKLIESQGQWFSEAKYLPLHMLKNNEGKYYQMLDESFLKLDWLSSLMLEHPLLCQLLFGIGLPLELFAFIALRNRKLAAIFGLTLYCFHWSVMQLMSLFFVFNMALLLTFLICPWWWIKKWFARPS